MTLTARALLSGASQSVLAASTLLIGLVVTPLLVAGLGTAQYGAWCMLLQFITYAGLFDVGNTTVLKLRLAQLQGSGKVNDAAYELGAAAVGAVLALPVYGAAIWVLLSALSSALGVAAEIEGVKSAALLLAASLLVQRAVNLFSHVLFGVNLDYKGTLSRTIVGLLMSLADVVVVLSGFGLSGLAVNRLAASLALLAIHVQLVRRYVSWLRVRIPTTERLSRSLKENTVYVMSNWGSVLTESVDVMLVGWFTGPITAAGYSLTTAPVRVILTTFGRFVTAGNPGLGKLFGLGRRDHVAEVKDIAWTLMLAGVGACGSWALLVNDSFISLWVGPHINAGRAVLVGFVAFHGLLLLTRFNQGLWMAAMDVPAAAKSNFWSAAAGWLGAAAALASGAGMLGMLLGLAGGRLVSVIHSEYRLGTLLGRSIWQCASIRRASGVAVGLVIVAYGIGSLEMSSWLAWSTWALGTGLVISVVTWMLALGDETRDQVRERVARVVRRNGASREELQLMSV